MRPEDSTFNCITNVTAYSNMDLNEDLEINISQGKSGPYWEVNIY